uniref:Uncharacterized protein n=1 Tax=Anopheles minimus TaxID=112268 RepID=A0A182WN23_9DIPT
MIITLLIANSSHPIVQFSIVVKLVL